MTPDEQAEVSRLYMDAYNIHYTNNDMRKAFGLYRRILARYPYSKEAGHAASQIQVIINTVVPEEERLTVQMDLAAVRFNTANGLDEESDMFTPPDAKKPN